MPSRRRIKKVMAETEERLRAMGTLLTASELEEKETDIWTDLTEEANRYYNPDSMEGDIMELY